MFKQHFLLVHNYEIVEFFKNNFVLKMSAIDVGSKKHYFTFKENMAPMPTMHRMAPSMSSSKYGREQMARVFETPYVMSNRKFNNIPYNDSVSYKESYSSAIEPMDYDESMDYEEWGNDGQERHPYEMDTVPTMLRSRVHVSREPQPVKKKIKTPSSVKAKQMTLNRLNFMEKPLHQSILSVDSSKGLSFHVDPNQRKVFSPSPMTVEISSKKVFPAWSVPQSKTIAENKNLSLPRMFTVTIDKLQRWPKVLTGTKVIFELYGILDNVTQGIYPRSKNIILKCEEKRSRLNCTFYEIDRAFPAVEKGHWKRCIVLLRSNGNCQCLAIRSAKSNELKNLDKKIMSSSKEKALLLRALSP